MNQPRTENMKFTELPSLAGSIEFDAAIDRDFGSATENHTDGFSRRRWLQIMGASLALGGTVGCRYEEEKIAPFAFRPQNRVPGVPERFATMIDHGGVAQPIMSTNYDGRPIKLDGNPSHPCSMGASSTHTQARILEFYDPDRLRVSLKSTGATNKFGNLFEDTSFEEIVAAFKPLLATKDLSKVAVLAYPSSSPTLMRMQESFTARGGSWISYGAVSDDNTRAGAKLAFGKPVRAQYRFEKAKVIVTLDADPLFFDSGSIPNSIAFAKGRDADAKQMSRLYAVESQYSTTGGVADHRISVPSHKIAGFAAALSAAVTAASADVTVDKSLPYRERLLAAMVQDLVTHKGAGIVIAGESQPPAVHALVHALNEKLGNNGVTIEFVDLSDSGRTALEAIQDFANQVGGGGFETLIVLGGNPVFDAPRELKLVELIGKMPNSVHLTLYKNETSLVCKWVSNVAHPLETWKDGLAHDGSVLIGQPLINPLFDGKSEMETLAAMLGEPSLEGQQIIRETLRLTAEDSVWRQAVHDGFVAGTATEPSKVSAAAAPQVAADDSWSKPWDGNSMEIVFNPSQSLYDGQFANNSWMLELPNFFTKIAWDNVASVSPRTADKLALKQGMLVTLNVAGAKQEVPVNIQPGQADGSIGIDIGWGRTAAGRVGGDVANGVAPVGHDVNGLRKIANWSFVAGLGPDAVVASKKIYKLAIAQEPWTIDETGKNEIQARMFRDYNKQESDRSGLLREGSFESYREFLEHHPLKTASSQSTTAGISLTQAVAKNGALPILNQVVFVPDDKAAGQDEHADGHGHEHSDGHGHEEARWPEAFHMHHQLFDLTPGSREDYKQSNPAHVNMWGKSIDLNKCIGCNACVVACQSENNVPVVGKDDSWRGREMYWIRIDRYFGDNLYTDDAKDDDKVIIHQPVACHHCENAPCETVCPVAATVHSSEGLNDMVYNRCIGVRYCGNNCPYKVRRFNYFNYTDAVTLLKYPGGDKLPAGDRSLQNLMMNPEVTIRSRGVMEKCTYCVQRIQNVKIKAKNEGRRPIGDNEITTACQDVCPTQAIKFGDLNNPASDVAAAHANPRAYSMLEDLNNIPRTKYLARVRNPHPQLIDRDDRNSVRGWKKTNA